MKSIYFLSMLAAGLCGPTNVSTSAIYSVELTDRLGSGDVRETVLVRQGNTVLATLNVDQRKPETSQIIRFTSPGPHTLSFSSATVTKGQYRVNGDGKAEIRFTNQDRLRYLLMGTYRDGRNTISLGQME